MALDPTKHADWEIAQDAEKTMLTIYEIGEKLGLTKEELLPQGHYIAKIDFRKVLARLKDKQPEAAASLAQGVYDLSLLSQREMDAREMEQVVIRQTDILEKIAALLA